MSQARAGLRAIAVENKIYAIGGYTVFNTAFDGRGFVGTNECYDPLSDTWITLKSMPTARSNFAIAAYEGKIYCIGGEAIDERDMLLDCRVNEAYDVATNSWSTKASPPFDGKNLSSGVVDDKIFVITDYALFIYDPVVDAWTEKSCLPGLPWMDYMYSNVVDDKIIVTSVFIEGYNFGPKVFVNDPKTDEWTEKTEGYIGVFRGGAEVITGRYAPQRVHVLGHTTSPDGLFTNQVYDPINDTWSTAKGLPTHRQDFGTAVVNDVLYVIGGNDYGWQGGGASILSLNEQYIPIGYNTQNYFDTQPSAMAPTVPSETTSKSFLNNLSVIVILFLTVCICIGALFFYLKPKKVMS